MNKAFHAVHQGLEIQGFWSRQSALKLWECHEGLNIIIYQTLISLHQE